MEKKLKELMAELFNIKEADINDSLTMRDTDVWDSLKHMELIVSIEATFGIELNANDIVAMQNVKKIKRILEEKGVSS